MCPLVEESEALQARAATAEYERLRGGELRDYRVALLHGQMRSKDKQAAMLAFAAGGADVLVATTVIEVGIDVPNATVMLIEGAERYGISQLHQLRGRVGRGEHASVCLLFGPKHGAAAAGAGSATPTASSWPQIDLELRGEGEIAGTRQSGLAQFRSALPEDEALARGGEAVRRDAVGGRPRPGRAGARAAGRGAGAARMGRASWRRCRREGRVVCALARPGRRSRGRDLRAW